MSLNHTKLPSEAEVEEIASLLKEAGTTGDSAAEFSGHRLRLCVKIGERLIEWRQRIPRGQWEKFIGERLPALPESTRRDWMRLADAHVKGRLNIDNARGMRHAYQLAGLLPNGDSTGISKSGRKGESYLVHISRLVASLQHIDVEQLTARDRHTLRDRLKPVLVFVDRLA